MRRIDSDIDDTIPLIPARSNIISIMRLYYNQRTLLPLQTGKLRGDSIHSVRIILQQHATPRLARIENICFLTCCEGIQTPTTTSSRRAVSVAPVWIRACVRLVRRSRKHRSAHTSRPKARAVALSAHTAVVNAAASSSAVSGVVANA